MMVEEPRTLTTSEHNDSKGQLIKNKFHPKKEIHDSPKSPDTEDYGDSIKEWIPTPHEKIKEDENDDSIANVSAEGITDWLAEGQKTHLPLRRKIMSQEIKLPPKSPDTEDYGDSIKEWIPTPHEKIKEDEPDESIPNVSNEEIVDWLAEGQKKHEPLRRNKTKSAVNVENEKEDYSGEPLQPWIPAPHPKIKEDDDNMESFDNEVVGEWNPEA